MTTKFKFSFGEILVRIIALLVIAAALGCQQYSDRETGRSGAPRVVLIGIDAADWRVVESLLPIEALPHLASLAEQGAFGNLATVIRKPTASPWMQWTSLATGKIPGRHGILRDYARTPDENGYVGPQQSGMRKAQAIWNVLSEEGLRVGIVGWPATWPAERVNGYLASHYLKFRSVGFDYAATVKKKLQLTLTGTIYANANLNQTYPPSFYSAIQPVIEETERTDDAETYALFPSLKGASRQVFYDIKWNYVANEIITRIAIPLLENESLDFVTVVEHGIDVAYHRAHRAITLKPFVYEPDPETFGLMEEYYRYIDDAIGEVLDHSPNHTIVIVASEHGTVGGRHSFKAIDGILAVRGPGVRKKLRIKNASILDVFPTILYIYDLAIPRDIDGHVLKDLFTEEFQRNRTLRYTDSYDHARQPVPISEEFVRFDGEIMKRLKRIGFVME